MKRLLYLIQQAGALMNMPRAHVRNLGNAVDTIASHSHHVSVIAYLIAKEEGLSEVEALRAMAMGVFHDLAEMRTGDMDFVAKHYVKVDEEKAIKDQFADISFSKDMESIMEEWETRETLTSKCAKDADSLQQMYMEWMLMWYGNKVAEKWFEGDFKDRVPNFYTKTAVMLATQMKDSWPNEWWWVEFTEDGAAKDITKLVGKKAK